MLPPACNAPLALSPLQTAGPLGAGVQTGYFLLMRVAGQGGDMIEDAGAPSCPLLVDLQEGAGGCRWVRLGLRTQVSC